MTKPTTMEKLASGITLSSDLELDLRAHVDFYFEVVRAHAHAQSDVAGLKFQLDQVEAELLEATRADAQRAGEKITVDACSARVRVSREYTAAKQAVLNAEREQGEWQALKLGYEARGHCLRDLTLLSTRGGSATGISDYQTLREKSAAARQQTTPQPRAPLNK